MILVNRIRSLVAANITEQREEDSRAYFDRLILGDCVKMMRKMPAACVDFVLTDPPYVAHYKDRSGRQIQNDDNAEWIYPAFREAFRVLKDDAFCLSFYGWNKVDSFFAAWKESGFRPVGHFTWVKRYRSSVGFTQACHECAYLLVKGRPEKPSNPPPDVLSWQYSGNKLHPTQKPVTALTPLIEAYTQPGDLILDPFGGSGSTAVAARHCNRHYVLFEIDESYFNAAKFRLLTGSRN